jgi:DNA helicase-2/ATP-dependent DNA helicase PcrA
MTRAADRGLGEQEDTGISLLTYFRAKGRQWHTVILPSCNEGLIPHGRARLEEERRLFYVAITRCSANLLISYLKRFGNSIVEMSRFLLEAGFA